MNIKNLHAETLEEPLEGHKRIIAHMLMVYHIVLEFIEEDSQIVHFYDQDSIFLEECLDSPHHIEHVVDVSKGVARYDDIRPTPLFVDVFRRRFCKTVIYNSKFGVSRSYHIARWIYSHALDPQFIKRFKQHAIVTANFDY